MNKTLIFQDLGLISYARAWAYQKALFASLIQHKTEHSNSPNLNYLIFCEHPPVFTLGKNGQAENLLIDKKQLNQEGINFFKVDRGGDITYHGPGQLVGYLVLDLDNFGIGLKTFVSSIEQAIIQLLAKYRIQGEQMPKSSGVWIEQDRKICALGIRASRMVTMHGFALNVNTNLQHFTMINPCGYVDKRVTSMEAELGKAVPLEKVKTYLRTGLSQTFEAEILEDFLISDVF